jgi:hypothetical protein
MTRLIFCAFLHACLYSAVDVSTDEFNPDAAKTLDKSCGDGGSIAVVNGAGGSIDVVDGPTGASADKLRPEARLRDEVVPEWVPLCDPLDEVVPLEIVLLRDLRVPREEIVDWDKESMVGIGGVDTNEEGSSVVLQNA